MLDVSALSTSPGPAPPACAGMHINESVQIENVS
jgi:hypothetical protein